MKQKFKVGDVVRSKRYPDMGHDTIATLFSRDASPTRLSVTYESGGYDLVDDIELVSPAPTFKIGDRVNLIGHNPGSDTGTVVRVENGEFIVVWDSANSGITWRADELYRDDGSRATPAAPPLKPGARVYITAGRAHGLEGTIVGVNDNAINIHTDGQYEDRAGQLMRHVSVNKAHVRAVGEAA